MNNKVLAKKIIELFPIIEERYLIECLANINDKNLENIMQEEELAYLTSEITERMKFFAYDHKNKDVDHSFEDTIAGLYYQLKSQLKKRITV